MKKEEIKNKMKGRKTSTTEEERYTIDRYQLRQFLKQGYYDCLCKNGQQIKLLYEPNAFHLENGEAKSTADLSKEDHQVLDHFFSYPKKTEKSVPLLEKGKLPHETLDWTIEHLGAIEEVVGFPIQNVKKKEKIRETIGFFESVIVDLYGEDGFGEKIVMNCDSLESKDRSLVSLFCIAILIEAKKIILVANEIKDDHQIIVKWLNEYFSQRIQIYLVEAKQVILENNKTRMCQFRLVESPMSGWINHF